MDSGMNSRISPRFVLGGASQNVGVVFSAFDIREAHRAMGQRSLGIGLRGVQLRQEEQVRAPVFGRVTPPLPQNATVTPPTFRTRPGGVRALNEVGLLDAANVALRLEKLSQTPPEKRTKEQNYEIAILQRDLRQNVNFSGGQVTREEWELAKKTMAAPIPSDPVTGKKALV